MNLRPRLWLPVVATAIVTVVSALLLAWADRQRDTLDQTLAAAQQQADVVGRARLLVDGNVTRALAGVYGAGSELAHKLAPDVQRADRDLAALAPALDALSAPSAPDLRRALTAVGERVAAARKMKEEGDVGGARELVDGPLQTAAATFAAAVSKVLDETEVAQRQGRQQAERSRQLQLLALALAVIFLLGVTIASAALLARSICGPIEQVQAFARRVADGDLMHPPGIATKDEIGQAMLALDAMRLSLAATVRRVLDSAASVLQASGQISAASSDLSQRVERSAASLVSLRALADQSREQAVAAAGTSGRLLLHCDAAHASNQAAASAVNDMIGIMLRVDHNARSVADSVQKVESIAFQTGILALNASIEAAHAGQSGRGFSVVAENVQVLARSSSDAAKDIQALIVANLGSTEIGQQRVAESSGAMDRVSHAFDTLAAQVRELTAAVQAQRSSVEQMSVDLEREEQVVAQNAAMSEQSAAAATHLRELAHALSESVACFRTAPDAQVGV